MDVCFQEIFERICHITNTTTQVELAKLLGIRQSSISDAKRRSSIPAEWYMTLFEKFGLNPDWLKKGFGPMYLRTEQGYTPSDVRLGTQHLVPSRFESTMSSSVPVPVYSCDCSDAEASRLKPLRIMSLPPYFVPPQIKVFSVNSAAMEPTILRKAHVGVDTSATRPVSGEIFALISPHEGIMLRRLYVNPTTQTILVRADAPAHPECSFPIGDLQRCILGRVSWVLQSF